jgi:hypothetical protein
MKDISYNNKKAEPSFLANERDETSRSAVTRPAGELATPAQTITSDYPSWLVTQEGCPPKEIALGQKENTGATPAAAQGNAPPGTRSVHIRDVAEPTWRRARTNAILSGMSFKEFVARLLAESKPFLTVPG